MGTGRWLGSDLVAPRIFSPDAPPRRIIRQILGTAVETILMPWPRFGAWEQDTSGAWRPAFPPLTLPSLALKRSRRKRGSPSQLAFYGFRYSDDDERRAFLELHRWMDSVPDPLRHRAQRFGARTIPVIIWFVSVFGKDAEDLLLTDGHTLVYGLAKRMKEGRLDPAQVPGLLRAKRKEIAHFLGFPPTKSCVRLLASIPAEHLAIEQPGPGETITGYDMIAAIAVNPEARQIMAHLPVITLDHMRILAFPPLYRRVTPALLHEIATTFYPFGLAEELADLLRMEIQLREPLQLPAVRPPFQSVAALRNEHDRLALVQRELMLNGDIGQWNVPFPAPPLPGTDSIIPLATPLDLLAEGRQCHNCVASYIPAVRDGGYYVYRVLNPQRATLGIVRNGKRWEIAQMKLPFNQRACPATWRAVRQWLKDTSPPGGRENPSRTKGNTRPAGRPARIQAEIRPGLTREETEEWFHSHFERVPQETMNHEGRVERR